MDEKFSAQEFKMEIPPLTRGLSSLSWRSWLSHFLDIGRIKFLPPLTLFVFLLLVSTVTETFLFISPPFSPSKPLHSATICVLPSFEDWLRAKGQSLRVETTQSEESGSNHKASSTISVPNRPITALPLNKQETTPEEDELILAYLKRKCIEQERKIPLGQLHEILLWEEARWTDLRHLNRSISFFQSL